MNQPDLFVVCKNCGSEVSPYVTECSYCGKRLRKRAPKLDRGADSGVPPRMRQRARLPRLRAGEIRGIAPETRPYATLLLIAVSLAATVGLADGVDLGHLGAVTVPDDQEPWRYATAPFLHGGLLGYQFVTLVGVGIFGTLLERRFGPLPVIATFLAAGAAGVALAVVVDLGPLLGDSTLYSVFGANGATLGLLVAWLVDDRRAARKGDERESDLLGVCAIAAVLVLLSVAVEEANLLAAAGGALTGAVVGLALPAFTRR